ncbi:hypothetical protein ACN27J_32305 [Solwaraspora sp. WMMB762]|uniref:hypothetical protein n=1 Tax=Solwaraspora sp. WMMB762 TaxID=3404120 RepID=UPI003B93D641
MRSAAACNNAGWCAAVSRSHGCPDTVDDAAWCSARRTPPYYPDAVTLRPDATPADILDRIDTTSPGCSVKDSFATLDLTPDGFVELFGDSGDGRPAGGFVLTCDGDVVGLSNLFAADSSRRSDVWTAAIIEAAAHFPGLPLVGYEQGDDLARARAHGFAPIGALRVWLHQPGQP